MSHYPILYSLQHCPYAMRARMGILLANQCVRLRAIKLNNKPTELLQASPKATVPVLIIDNEVIDESLNIMLWALKQNDPNDLLYKNKQTKLTEMLELISLFDTEFKKHLEKYKSAKRYHSSNKPEHRKTCEGYIAQLEQKLTQHEFLMGEKLSLVDYALLPFIRQFSRIERQWFLASPYPKLRNWLISQVESPSFAKVMAKYPLWLDNNEEILFGTTTVS